MKAYFTPLSVRCRQSGWSAVAEACVKSVAALLRTTMGFIGEQGGWHLFCVRVGINGKLRHSGLFKV